MSGSAVVAEVPREVIKSVVDDLIEIADGMRGDDASALYRKADLLKVAARLVSEADSLASRKMVAAA
jgi:hypothetical protein